VGGSRDFVDRAAYAQFLHDLVWQRNRTQTLMSLPFR
jgi:hypothetical protein